MVFKGNMFYSEEEIRFIYGYAKQQGLEKNEVELIMDGKKSRGLQVTTLTPKEDTTTMFGQIFKQRFIVNYIEQKIISLDGQTLEQVIDTFIKDVVFDRIEKENKAEEEKDIEDLKKKFLGAK